MLSRMTTPWKRWVIASGVLAALTTMGCWPRYTLVRASPPATWRGTAAVTALPVDWSGVQIDGRPHAAFAAQLAEDRRPLLYGDMEAAGDALRRALVERHEVPPLRTSGVGPQLRLEVIAWERGYWAAIASRVTVLRVRGTLERTAGSSEDVAEFVEVVHHEITYPHPAAGLERAAEWIVGRIRPWLEDCMRR